MGCVYYTFAALFPEFLSSLENIFVAFLFHSSDKGLCKVNNKSLFSALIKDLIELQESCIQISVNSEVHTICFLLD